MGLEHGGELPRLRENRGLETSPVAVGLAPGGYCPLTLVAILFGSFVLFYFG